MSDRNSNQDSANVPMEIQNGYRYLHFFPIVGSLSLLEHILRLAEFSDRPVHEVSSELEMLL
jgi:hypothetical protein